MALSALCLHRGARLVEKAELENVPVPPATDTWFPLPHAAVLDRVMEMLGQAGFAVRSEKLALSRSDARFFGTLDLDSPITAGVSLCVGVRNSIDKSFPLGFVAGHRVFVCDNLAFRADLLQVKRKHTRFGERRYSEAIAAAVQSLGEFRSAEEQRVRLAQQLCLSDQTAESLMLRAYERNIVSHRLLPRVIREWRSPSFEEFSPRTLWSLFNACVAKRVM